MMRLMRVKMSAASSHLIMISGRCGCAEHFWGMVLLAELLWVEANGPSYHGESTGWATVCAFDQGGTTGWTVASVAPTSLLNAEKPIHKCIEHMASGQITGTEDQQADEMLDLAFTWPDAALLLETFIIRKFLQHHGFLSPVRIEEKFRYGLHLYAKAQERKRPRYVYKQQPSLAMDYCTDARQKQWGFWHPGEPHANDATKHAVTFLERCRDPQRGARMRASAWPLLFKSNGEVLKRAPQTSKSHTRYKKRSKR